LTASLSTFASQLNRKGGLPNDLVTDRTTYASLVDTVGRLHHASERTSDLMDGLALGAGDPNTPIGTLMRDKQAGEDLKVTLSNMNRSSLLLTEDLEALQHNFLFRGFFRRREKAEAKAAKEEAEFSVTEVHPTPDR
jgi:phospholipid/cholesterol/gamma-HCH transport system substrate-binding protein